MAIEHADLEAELHEAQLVAHVVVVVGIEACLLGVERLCAIDVGDRDRDELELPVHCCLLRVTACACGR